MTCAPAGEIHRNELVSTDRLKDSWLRSETVEFGDPTLARLELTHRAAYYPLGFGADVWSNSTEALDCARESWEGFSLLFERPPITINIVVTEGSEDDRPGPPVCRMRDHILTNIADAENFSVVDLARGTAFVSVTLATIRDREYFRYFFLESSAMALIANRYATGIHAACVEWNGAGVLLCGDSGAGKSTLAYACARAGWTYVTDDGSYLVHQCNDAMVVGNCRQVRFRPDGNRFFPELQGKRAMTRSGTGKPSLEWPLGGAVGMKTSATSCVKHVVFLSRGSRWEELVGFPSAVARLYFAQRIHCMPYASAMQLESIGSLLRLGSLELRYASLDWAVERLQLLADEGH